MKTSLNISEFVLILLGVTIKIILRRYVTINSLISLSYSSTDNWETILESNALQNSNLQLYDGDFIHQPPLVLLLWKFIIKFSNNYELFPFCFIDVACIYVTLQLSNEIICKFIKHQETLQVKETSLLVNAKNLRKLRFMLCLWHVFNPFLNISILSQSITCFNNWLFLLLFINIVRENFYTAAALCALLTYCNLYPALFVLVLIAGAIKKKRRYSGIVAAYVACLSSLLAISWYMVGYKFISNVYGHHFYMNDSNPQMNFYWYMMATMFDHFRLFFKCTFQLIIITVSGGLVAKYKDDIIFLTYMLAWTINVVKPYPSIGEIGQLLALLPLYHHLFKYLRFGIVTAVMLLSVLVLSPLMHYLWLVNGTANANFYFAITLVYCAAQSYLFSSILSAYIKYYFYLKHGKDVKFSDGTEIYLRAQ